MFLRIVHLKGYVFFSSCVSVVKEIERKFQHEDRHKAWGEGGSQGEFFFRGWGGKETWVFFDLPGKKVVLRLGFTSNHWKKGA